jgi:hypothetical protein
MQTHGGAGDRTLDLGIKSPVGVTAPYRYLGAWPRFRARFALLHPQSLPVRLEQSPQYPPHHAA